MKNILILILSLYTLFIQAQSIERQVVGSVGGQSDSGTMNVDFTLGEVAVQTVQTGSVFLTQGYHQATESTINTEELNVTVQYKMYPNPVTDIIYLELETENNNLETFIHLVSIEGKIVDVKKINLDFKNKLSFNIKELSSGTYFIKIFDESLQNKKAIQFIKQ